MSTLVIEPRSRRARQRLAAIVGGALIATALITVAVTRDGHKANAARPAPAAATPRLDPSQDPLVIRFGHHQPQAVEDPLIIRYGQG
jgi:hypothetical protein